MAESVINQVSLDVFLCSNTGSRALKGLKIQLKRIGGMLKAA